MEYSSVLKCREHHYNFQSIRRVWRIWNILDPGSGIRDADADADADAGDAG
jgi:hypothetical protein